jgi:tetratricopeptide (TPR) repeat protein
MTRLDACTADAELIALCKRCLSAKPEDRPKDGQAVAAEVAAYRASVEQRLRQAETDRARAETQAAEQRKRRRVWIGLAATLFIGLVASSALAAWAMQAERVASAERDAKDEALREAERNLGFCRKGNELLGSVFSSLDPYSHYATVAEFRGVLKQSLRKAVAELEGTAIGDPLTVAAMQNTLGGSLLGLGEGELAIAMFEKSWSTRKDVLGPNHADTLTSMNNLALGYQVAGKWDEAIALTEKTLQRMRSALGPDHADTLACMNNLAMGYRDLGQMDKAQRLLQETVNLMRTKFGEDHPTTLASMNNLAECYRNTGLIDKAVLLHTEIMKLRQARLGSDHPRTLESMSNLAAAHHAAGRLDASLSLLEETLPLMRSRLGSDHPHTLAAMNNLAFAYKETEKLEKALALYQESLRLKRAKLGDDHPETLTTINNLAECYRKLGQMGRVVSLLEETVRLRRRKLGNDHPATINSIGNLGAAYCAVCDGERAAPLLKEFITGSRKQYPANDPKFANLLTFISLDLLGCGQFAPAEEMLRECLAIREKIQPDDWNTFNTVFLLGEALLGQKKYAEAEPLLVKGYEGMKQALRAVSAQEPRSGDASSFAVSIRIAEALERLIQHYDNTDQAEEAAKYRNAMADWWRERITRQPLSQLIWGWPRW